MGLLAKPFRTEAVQAADGAYLRWQVPEQVADLSVSPDGKMLLTREWDAPHRVDTVVRLWEVATGRQMHLASGRIVTAAFSPSGQHLVVCTCDGVEIHEPLTTTPVEQFEKPPDWPRIKPCEGSLAFSPDGSLLALHYFAHMGTGVIVWDVESREIHKTLSSGRGMAYERPRGPTVAFSPDGSTLAAITTVGTERRGGTVSLWDTTTWNARAHFQPRGLPGSLAFSPDGRLIAVASRAQPDWQSHDYAPQELAVELWDAQAVRRVVVPRFPSGFRRMRDLAYRGLEASFANDGKLVASGGSGLVKLWEVETQICVGELDLEREFADLEGSRKSAQLTPGQKLAARVAGAFVSFSPTEDKLAVAYGDTVWVWELAKVLDRLKPRP